MRNGRARLVLDGAAIACEVRPRYRLDQAPFLVPESHLNWARGIGCTDASDCRVVGGVAWVAYDAKLMQLLGTEPCTAAHYLPTTQRGKKGKNTK